jgi:hypothetical protein
VTAAWFLFAAFCLAFLAFLSMTTAAIRLASRVNDAERKLKASKQAHALDVQALTAKLLEAKKANHE